MGLAPDWLLTFVELSRWRAIREPDRRAYTFLDFTTAPARRDLTYAQLDRHARAIAVQLRRVARAGDRALLLFQPGPDFVTSFLGCLYAGLIAVPAPVPRHQRGALRLQSIIDDADAAATLSTTDVQRAMAAIAPDPAAETAHGPRHLTPPWICVDTVDRAIADEWQAPVITPADLAFLQYTSGSTGRPKGTMISHRNLMHQSAVFHRASGGTSESCLVSWVPTFHDLGLVAGVLQPLFAGFPGVLMAPLAFVEEPARWLQAISDHRADMTIAPNFGYELCVSRISAAQRETLDLECLRFAVNGAEPVKARTLREFVERFGPCGFRASSFFPAWGLAEATLMASGASHAEGPTQRRFDAQALEQNRIAVVDRDDVHGRTLVGCGRPANDFTIAIVDPETHRRVDPATVGEIWVSSPSVGQGYWRRPDESRETFEARLVADTGSKPYLRTGDLGFMHDGEVFICGRLKDLILLRGRNHHAPDIEVTVEESHPALRRSFGAAFPITIDDDERLVVAHEVDRAATPLTAAMADEIMTAIRRAIAEEHEIQAQAVILLQHGTIPKTSSGKIQRRECRARILDGRLSVLASWSATHDPAPARASAVDAPPIGPEAREAASWFAGEVAACLGVAASAIKTGAPIAELRLTPDQTVRLTRTLEQRFQRPLSTTVLTEFPTIDALLAHLTPATVTASAGESGPRPSITANVPIAVIGIGCRFPGATGPQDFWSLLRDGRQTITEVPASRWDVEALYDPNPLAPGKISTRYGGFLDDVHGMDVKFFGLTTREAMRMDPQQRLMLEVAWEALEDAGVIPGALAGAPVGVFVGVSLSDYGHLQFSDPMMADAYAGIGAALTIAASRVSYFLNLRGPAVAIDTACSSSLMAVHLACGSIWRGESTMALAGGVNVMLAPVVTMCLTKAGLMAPDGRCKAFDARANGYVRSDGAGLVVLKPLAQARADGDPIYAVIRGTASNQDGHSSGLTAPNGEAQQAVIRAACQHAGISPGQLDYIEAHGTGTAVGDPIEVNAIGAVVAVDRPAGEPCAIGSVKTNIGHAESAAGIASVIKTSLILKHRQIPPSLHFETPNPLIPFDTLPVRVQTALAPLPARSRPALAGVNGFGVGGTNVHVILEEAPHDPPIRETVADARGFVLPLSARSEASLARRARKLLTQLRDPAIGSIEDLCYTASRRRAHLEHRLAVVGPTTSALADALAAHLDRGRDHGVVTGIVAADQTAPKLAFVFSGQGSQWPGMGCDLLAHEPVFRDALDECDARLRAHTGWSLLDALSADVSRSRLDETEVAQPALFAIQVALARLLASWGLTPDAVIGHSVGEIAAAHIAGALDLAAACRLVAHRGRLMQEATGAGSMASVELPAAEIEPLLRGRRDRLAIAAINSPTSVVLSGDAASLTEIVASLEARNIVTKRLPVNYAFHSPQMRPFGDRLIERLDGLRPAPLRVPMYSTVLGGRCGGEALDARYWGANIREPVSFAPAIERLAQAHGPLFLEIGPHPVLCSAIARTLRAGRLRGAAIATLRRDQDGRLAMLTAFGALYTHGRSGNWAALYPNGIVSPSLPLYQWDRQRCWLEGRDHVAPAAAAHPLLGTPLPAAERMWQKRLDLPQLSTTRGAAAPRPTRWGSVLIEMALGAAREAFGARLRDLEEVTIHEIGDLFTQGPAPTTQVTVAPELEGESMIRIYAQADDAHAADTWRLCLTARATLGAGADGAPVRRRLRVHDLPEQRPEGTALVEVEVPDAVIPELTRYCLHPVVLDAALESCRLAQGVETPAMDLARVQRIRLAGPPTAHLWAYAQRRGVRHRGEEIAGADLTLADDAGDVVAVLEGVQCRPREAPSRIQAPDDPADWVYETLWRAVPRLTGATESARPAGAWLILTDAAGIGDDLAAQLAARGERCVRVRRGRAFRRISADVFEVSPTSAAEIQRVIQTAFAADAACTGIVHLWSVDATSAEHTTARSLDDDQALTGVSIMALVQALVASACTPRLWLVTQGAQGVRPDAPPTSLSQSTVWGMGLIVVQEHPELRCRRVDLDVPITPRDIEALADECWASDGEDQVALRDETLYVRRLVQRAARAPHTSPALDDRLGPFRVDLPASSTEAADSPGIVPRTSRRPPAAGEVELCVHTAGLAVADGSTATTWGSDECAGTVVRVGEGVTDLQVGDEVVALVPDAIAAFLTVPATSMAARPTSLDVDQAATAPRAFVTAMYALRDVAKLTAGEHVLIHGAGSRVGLAAVRVATWLGATAILTAADESDRERLTRLGLRQVLDAGSMSVSAEVLALTGGHGVDVLLNCTSGWPLVDYLRLLRLPGRCVQVAGPGADGDEAKRVRVIDNVSFHTVSIDRLQQQRPAYVRDLLGEVLTLLHAHALTALPARDFPLARAVDALRCVRSPAAFGKVAIHLPPPPESAPAPRFVRDDATYLITGGLGGLGLAVARRLVQRGARHLVLVGRRSPSPETTQILASLRDQGARVTVATVDVADKEALRELLSQIRRSAPPLRGVVHAAGVLDNALLVQLDEARFKYVMPPKLAGAWNLHQLTLNAPLDWFVLFSSLASLIGSPGQANYAAANAFLDALALYRRSRDLPALSIGWGPWAEIGMAAIARNERRLADLGMAMLPTEPALDLFERLVASEQGVRGAIAMNWSVWARVFPAAADTSCLCGLVPGRTPQAAESSGTLSIATLRSLSPAARLAQTQEAIHRVVCRTLQLDPADLEMDVPLSAVGLDSIIALELKNRLESMIDLVVQTPSLLGGPTIQELSAQLLAQLDEPARAAPPAPAIETDALLAQVDCLSDAEAGALLARLAQL